MSFIRVIHWNMGKQLLAGVSMTQRWLFQQISPQCGWQFSKVGNLEFTVQPTGSSTRWRVSFHSGSVYVSPFQVAQNFLGNLVGPCLSACPEPLPSNSAWWGWLPAAFVVYIFLRKKEPSKSGHLHFGKTHSCFCFKYFFCILSLPVITLFMIYLLYLITCPTIIKYSVLFF